MTGKRIPCNADTDHLAIEDQGGSNYRQPMLMLDANAGGSIRLRKATLDAFRHYRWLSIGEKLKETIRASLFGNLMRPAIVNSDAQTCDSGVFLQG
jgi:hypothetical protein